MLVTSFVGGCLSLLLLLLTFLVSQQRGVAKVSLGDGGDPVLQLRIRAFGNFSEYAPMGLILLALIEYGGSSALILWALGAMLVVGRVLHALGMYVKALGIGRLVGMLMNYIFFLGAGITLILSALT